MTVSIWKKTTPDPPKRHYIEDVHFTHGQDSALAPVSCICGWRGTVAEHDEHRLGPKTRNVAKTCPNGHERTPLNTYTSRHGFRSCLICRREQARRHYAKKAS